MDAGIGSMNHIELGFTHSFYQLKLQSSNIKREKMNKKKEGKRDMRTDMN
jgi:hypothetical protein